MKIKANLTSYLRFLLTIIPSKVRLRSIADWAGTFIRNVTFNSTKGWFNGFSIAFFVVRNKISPLPVLFVGYDSRKFINLEFLVSKGFSVIISPLLKWDVFTDK